MARAVRLRRKFFEDPKVMMLEDELGAEGVCAFLRLWTWAVEYFPETDVIGVNEKVISRASGWARDASRFVNVLKKVGLICETEGGFQIRCTGYISAELRRKRSEAGKKGMAKRWGNNKGGGGGGGNGKSGNGEGRHEVFGVEGTGVDVEVVEAEVVEGQGSETSGKSDGGKIAPVEKAPKQEDLLQKDEIEKWLPNPSEVVEEYHRFLPGLPRVKILDEQLRRQIRDRSRDFARMNSSETVITQWRKFFLGVSECPFLMGKKGDRSWRANLRWLVKPQNFRKVVEGYYIDFEEKDRAERWREMQKWANEEGDEDEDSDKIWEEIWQWVNEREGRHDKKGVQQVSRNV